MIQPKTLPGFMELLPDDQILFNQIKQVIQNNYESFGFLPLDTPIIESSEVLLAKAGGETEKQIYSFKKGDNDLCLRFDLTVPLAKYVAEYSNQLSFPFARYQIGKVYRGEKPQKGRFREFYQCDIDVVGKNSLNLAYDALVPSIMYRIFKQLNIDKFTIFVSNRKILFGLIESLGLKDKAQDILRLIDKFDKIGEQNFRLSLLDLQLDQDIIQKIVSFIKISGTPQNQLQFLENLGVDNPTFLQGVLELKQVIDLMQTFGVEDGYYNINLSIARGLDYYTGSVYETFIVGHENLGSICSGGRYDNLAGFYSNQNFPGVGMSIGLTRLFYLLKQNNLINLNTNAISKAVILPMGDTTKESITLSNILRQNGINCTLLLEQTKFKNKLVYATNQHARYAIIIGEDEVKNNYYTLKDLSKFEQQSVDLDTLIQTLKNS